MCFFLAVSVLVESGALEGSRSCEGKIEWVNAWNVSGDDCDVS